MFESLLWIYCFGYHTKPLMSDSVPQDDLLSLKVGSVLHHLSIKRAIQVLRLNNYEPNCLRRRPSDEVHPPEKWLDGAQQPVLLFHSLILWCFGCMLTFPSSSLRTIFLQQRFPSGPTIGWWSGCGLWTSLNTLPTWEAAVCTEAWWWDGLVVSLPCEDGYSILKVSNPQTSFLSSGSRAAVQRRDHGFAAEHPPQQDAAAPPPRHTFQPAHWLRGSAAQTRVSWKSRLHSAYSHHKGQGNTGALEYRLLMVLVVILITRIPKKI